MSTQIFKNKIPNELLFNLLDKIALKNDKHYTFNSICFKKGLINGEIAIFLDNCKPYYHISKRKYLENNTYKSFTTILRQICNYNKIVYTSQLKYDRSNYDILYHVYI
jgi:predicted ribosome quality control (RQC) complex YloA/Tae2 family protein